MIVMIVVCEACDDDKVLVLVTRCTEEWEVRGGEMFPVRGSAKDCGISLLSGATQLSDQRYSDERSAGERWERDWARPGQADRK